MEEATGDLEQAGATEEANKDVNGNADPELEHEEGVDAEQDEQEQVGQVPSTCVCRKLC